MNKLLIPKKKSVSISESYVTQNSWRIVGMATVIEGSADDYKKFH